MICFTPTSTFTIFCARLPEQLAELLLDVLFQRYGSILHRIEGNLYTLPYGLHGSCESGDCPLLEGFGFSLESFIAGVIH